MKTKLMAMAAGVVLMAGATGCSSAETAQTCLGSDQVAAKIAQIDTYSVYDPARPQTLEQLSPEKLQAVVDVEGRACAPGVSAYRCGAEDDASWRWSRCGNKRRGVGVDTKGRRVVVGVAGWCRLRAAGVKMRPLAGDAWAAKQCR
jgi:hypothetical protein